ncbi:MAG: hypothetical protein VW907_00515 [Opitutae bacterium]
MAAIPGRWGGLRVEPYKPNPPDADLDGIIQEQTLWERPKGFVIAIVDAAGRLAEVRDGADHPRGVNQFRRNFVLARRDDNGVLERADGAHTPSWANAPLSPGELNGTLGDNGTLADLRRGSGNVERAVEAVVDPPIDRRAELRKRYPDISDAGLEMMLWEPTDDPDEIDRRLGFIEDLYGEDVSTNLRQLLDGVPPGDRVDADFSEMREDLPERTFYVNVFGDDRFEKITHAVFGHESRDRAEAVCAWSAKSLAMGMPDGLRVKDGAAPNCDAQAAKGGLFNLGRGDVAVGVQPEGNQKRKRKRGKKIGQRPAKNQRLLSEAIEAYKKANPEEAAGLDDAEIENRILHSWATASEDAIVDHLGITIEEFDDLVKAHLKELVDDKEFRAALERTRTYYQEARRAVEGRANALKEYDEGFTPDMLAGMIAVMSPVSEFNDNLYRANKLATLLARDSELDVPIYLIIRDTLLGGGGFHLGNKNTTLDERLIELDTFLEKIYANNEDELRKAKELVDDLKKVVLAEENAGLKVTDLRQKLKDHIENTEDLPRLKFQPSAFGEEAADIVVLERLLHLYFRTTPGEKSIRSGGGATNIIAALEIYYGHRYSDQQEGPKTNSFFWNLFVSNSGRAAVDTWVFRGLLPKDQTVSFNIARKAQEALTEKLGVPFDPGSKGWQDAYVKKYGGKFVKINDGYRWTPNVTLDADAIKNLKPGEAGFVDFVSRDNKWAMRGTVDSLRAERSTLGGRRLKDVIRSGSKIQIGSEEIDGPAGWARWIERRLEEQAADMQEDWPGMTPEWLQAALWEHLRTTKDTVTFDDNGNFVYEPNPRLHDDSQVYSNILVDPDLLKRYRVGSMSDRTAPNKQDAVSRDLVMRRQAIMERQRLGLPLSEDDVRFMRMLSTMTEEDIRVLSKRGNRTKSQRTIGFDMKDGKIDESQLSDGLQKLLKDPEMRRILEESYIMFGPDESHEDVINLLNEIPENSLPISGDNNSWGRVIFFSEPPDGDGWVEIRNEDGVVGFLRKKDFDLLQDSLTQSCEIGTGKSSAFIGIELKAPTGRCRIVSPGLPEGTYIEPQTLVSVSDDTNFSDISPEVRDVVAHNILAGRDRSEWGAETRLSRVGLFQEHPQHRGFYLREDGNFYDASDNMLADDGDIVPSPEFLEESDRALRALSEGIRKFDADAAKRASQRQDRLYGSTSDEPEASPELIGQLRVAEAIGDNFVASVREMDDRYRQRAERPDGGGQFVYDLDEAARREKIREIEEAREQFSQSLQKFFDEERRYDPDNPPTVFMNTRSVAAREGAQRRSGGRPRTEAEAREEADRYRDIFKESLRELDEQAKRSEEWRNSERPMFRGPDRSYWSTSNIDSLSDSDRASRRSDIQDGLDNLWGEYGTGKGGDVTQRVGDSGGAYFQPPSDKAPEELLSTFASEKTSVLEEQLRTGRRRTAGGEVEMSDADRREAQTILDYLKNTSPEQQKKDIVDFLRRNVEDEDTVVAWRASPQTIGLVAEDGRIKTTHELEFSRPTGRTRADDVGATSPPTMRRAYETSIGIPVDTPDDERPVSGLVSYGPRRRRAAADILAQRQAELTPEEFALYDVRSDPLYMQAVSGAAEDYGTAMVEFKRDTNRNATFVIGDSLNIGGVPAGMENASDEELLRMVFDGTYRNAPNSADVTSHDRFMEMMILGRDEALGEGYAGSWRLPDSKVGRDSGYHEALLPGGSGIADVETVFLDGQYNTQVPGYRSGRPSLEVLQEQDRWMSLIPDEERDMLDEIVRLRGADSSEVQSALNAWKQLLNQFDESESRRQIEETLKKLNQDLKIQWLENRGVSLERRIAAAKERLGTDDPIDLLMRRNLEKLLEGIRKQHANLLGR